MSYTTLYLQIKAQCLFDHMQKHHLMKALKCKTLGAELAMHTHCIVLIVYIRAFNADDHLPSLNTHR